MKELALALSRLDLTWGRQAFRHCLTAALEDLALKGL